MADGDKIRVDCVGVICFRDDQVLLIRRGKAPRVGEWSLPGGRIEPGETEAVAALRELKEETGVVAKLGSKIAIIDADFEDYAYRLHDYAADWVSGDPVPDDDAMAACFMPIDQIEGLGMWSKTVEIIQQAWTMRTEIRARRNRQGPLT